MAAAVILTTSLNGAGSAQAQTPAGSGAAAPVPASTPAPRPAPAQPGLADPVHTLPKGWQSSSDRAVESIGDENGFNILVADASSGYTWTTAASLSEPGFDTPEWIGQLCVTGSGDFAAVTYAPWSFQNDADAFDHEAFAAIVDLRTGAVRKLPQLVSLAYYSPGCGTDDRVVFSALREGGTAPTSSALTVFDAATGRRLAQSALPGQITSAVPYGASSVAAVAGDRIVSVSAAGKTNTLTTTRGIALRLHPDAAGGLGYEVPVGARVDVQRYAAGRATDLGSAPLGSVQLAGVAGQVYVVGPDAGGLALGAKPAGAWQALTGTTVDTVPSTRAGLLVSSVSNHADPAVLGAAAQSSAQSSAQPSAQSPTSANASQSTATAALAAQAKDRITLLATVRSTGRKVSFTVDPGVPASTAGAGDSAASPALSAYGAPAVAPSTRTKAAPPAHTAQSTPTSGAAAPLAITGGGSAEAAGSSTDGDDTANPANVTWDPTRGCSVARNDPDIESYQATAQQVEWAADLAVQGKLTVNRPAGFRGSGLKTSWTPQGMFPLRPLTGGGTVPVQVLLGVLAQESNTLQASPHAVDAVLGNFNQGGFYGDPTSADPNTTWASSDCGYGVGQVTTDMQLGSTVRPADGSTAYSVAEEQQAVATDYATNIAATLNMLVDSWNAMESDGILANGGSPQYIENWWFATWAYNSGVEPKSAQYGNSTGCTPGPDCTDNGGAGGNWGLGWSNNPADPSFPSDRAAFNANTTFDVVNPQLWSYPEKVVGWTKTPLARFNYGAGQWQAAYAAGVWPAAVVDPSYEAFCTSADHCVPDGASDVDGTPDSAGECTLSNSHCWWNQPAGWTVCTTQCGGQVLTYGAGQAEPAGTDIYAPDGCTSTGSPADGSLLSAIPLPSNAVIVDMQDSGGGSGCGQTPTWKAQGSLSFTFNQSPPASTCTSQCIVYDGKIDFHQVGVGFGGHLWFAHTHVASSDEVVTGTWAPPSTVSGWTRVMVHIPDSGATTQQAPYVIHTNGPQGTETRYVNQHMSANTWVQLGVFDLGAGATVSLSNVTPDGAGDEDIAWDAAAFVPLSAKPKDFVVQLGDSYSSGTAAGDYIPNSNTGPYASISNQAPPPPVTAQTREWNACLRSQQSWIRDAVLPDDTSSVGALTDGLNSTLDYHSLACNGARSYNVDPDVIDGNTSTGAYNLEPYSSNVGGWGVLGQYDEIAQLSAGYLDANTTLVALTIGGNDADFSGTIEDCAPPDLSCPSDATVQGKLQTATNRDAAVIEDVHKLAPNAQIVLLGYPELFDVQSLLDESIIPAGAQVELNTWADDFEADQSATVQSLCTPNPGTQACTGIPVYYKWPTPRFVGAQDRDSPTGINDLVAGPASDDQSDFSCPGNPVCPSMESFHPTAVGTARYALALQDELSAIKYQ